MQPWNMQLAVEKWKDREELKPKPKEKWTFVDKQGRGKEASDRVVRDSNQESVYEMRKKQQYCEDAREI